MQTETLPEGVIRNFATESTSPTLAQTIVNMAPIIFGILILIIIFLVLNKKRKNKTLTTTKIIGFTVLVLMVIGLFIFPFGGCSGGWSYHCHNYNGFIHAILSGHTH